MSSTFWFSYAILWFLVAVLVLLVVLLYRQFGLAYMSGRQRISLQGLDIGRPAPPLDLVTSEGRTDMRWDISTDGLASLVVFASPTCGVCAALASELVGVPGNWPSVRFFWVEKDEGGHVHRAVEADGDWIVGAARDDEHESWGVAAVPFAFVVSADGEIVAKRLINTRADVEVLLGHAVGSPIRTAEEVSDD